MNGSKRGPLNILIRIQTSRCAGIRYLSDVWMTGGGEGDGRGMGEGREGTLTQLVVSCLQALDE